MALSTDQPPGIICILNGAAGSCNAEAARRLVSRIAEEYGQAVAILVARSGAELSMLVQRALTANDSHPIIAGGGDGTINAVASALVGGRRALGVLPLGTLNHFARDLGIPTDLEAAVRTIFTGQIARVDVGEVNGRMFLNNSSLGLYPRIVRNRERLQRLGYPKWIAFAQAVALVSGHYSTLRVRLRLDQEESLARATPFVFIGNNRYEIAGLGIGARKQLNEGRLWLCMAPRRGRGWGYLIRTFLLALIGRLTLKDLNTLDATNISIETDRKRLKVATDGEVNVMQSPLHYKIRPGALNVIVPIQKIQAGDGAAGGPMSGRA
jgi:diacylglycerol kinase family enzyme